MDSSSFSEMAHLYARSEDSVLDISTAPTTREGSVTFNPVLQTLKLHNVLEDRGRSSEQPEANSALLDADIRQKSTVNAICCVGAGYVGM